MAKKELTFEESMARLEEIVAELEDNEKPLNETIELFEEGLKLVKACNEKLSAFEARVKEITDSAQEAE